MRKRLLSALMCSLWALGLAQCGSDDSLSKEVRFKVVPTNPLLINADLKVDLDADGTDETIAAPWFIGRIEVANNSDQILNLVTIYLKGEGTNDRKKVEFELGLDPTAVCDDRLNFATIPANTVYRGLTDPCDSTAIDSDDYDAFYIYGLPETDDNVLFITVSGAGWFENDSGVPVERLTMSTFIITQ